jgi:hypothetical protein
VEYLPEEPVIELRACRTTIAMLRQRDYFCPSSTGFTMNQIGEMIAACLTGRRRSRWATFETPARGF